MYFYTIQMYEHESSFEITLAHEKYFTQEEFDQTCKTATELAVEIVDTEDCDGQVDAIVKNLVYFAKNILQMRKKIVDIPTMEETKEVIRWKRRFHGAKFDWHEKMINECQQSIDMSHRSIGMQLAYLRRPQPAQMYDVFGSVIDVLVSQYGFSKIEIAASQTYSERDTVGTFSPLVPN
jgi:hypothetical protein